MSVQSEITRLEEAKAAIAAAIAGKEVAVPSGTKLDAMAALIEAIETGGLNGISAFATGSFTRSSDTSAFLTISHGLGVRPNFYIVVAPSGAIVSDYPTHIMKELFFLRKFKTGAGQEYASYGLIHKGATATNSLGGAGAFQAVTTAGHVSTSSISIFASSTYMWKAGVKYTWYAGVIDGLY